jgi:hypothetical protein
MKNYQFNIILLSIILSTLAIVWKMEQRVDVHWMLPPNAECAVKMMYLRDENGVPQPTVRKVCHWRHQG